MRLTLRTLLAYLDGSLPGELIAQVEEQLATHETVRHLLSRMQEVVNRVRLTPPRLDPRDTMADPNRMAEYLDGTLDLDLLVDQERACLESDALLAEIVAGYQILSRLLREPMEVSERLRRRMLEDVENELPASQRSSERENLRAHAPHRLRPPRAWQSDDFGSDDTATTTPRAPKSPLSPLGKSIDPAASSSQSASDDSTRFENDRRRHSRSKPARKDSPSTPPIVSASAASASAFPTSSAMELESSQKTTSLPRTSDLEAAAAPSAEIQQRRLWLRFVMAASIVFPLGVMAAQLVGPDRPADWDAIPAEVSQSEIIKPTPASLATTEAVATVPATPPAATELPQTSEPAQEAPSPNTQVPVQTVASSEVAAEPADDAESADRMTPTHSSAVRSMLLESSQRLSSTTAWRITGDRGQMLQKTRDGVWKVPNSSENAQEGDFWITMPFDRTTIQSDRGIRGTLIGATAVAPFSEEAPGQTWEGLALHYGRVVLTFSHASQSMRMRLGGTEWSLEPLEDATVVAIEARPWLAPGEPIASDASPAPRHDLLQVIVIQGRMNLSDTVGIRTVPDRFGLSWRDGGMAGSGTIAALPSWIERSDALETACAEGLRRWTAVHSDRVTAWRNLVSHERPEIRVAAIACLSEIGIYDPAWVALEDASLAPAWRRWLIDRISSQFARSHEHALAFLNAAPSTPLALATSEVWQGVSSEQWKSGGANLLVDQLEHESLLIRTLAIDHLAALTGGTEQYIAEADVASRAHCVLAWRARLASNTIRPRNFTGPEIVPYASRN